MVSGSRALTEEQVTAVHRCARSGPVRYAQTIERLLDESVLLLHRQERRSQPSKRVTGGGPPIRPDALRAQVLVIDDDLRNIFALTSVLEHRDLKTIHAENGRAGIELLKSSHDIDIVLMDIMMPEMDGYESMRAIRKIAEFQSLPIVALTAKAMKGDREKCLQAGASDYVTKPVDLDLLFSVMRVWMARDVDTRFEHGALSLPNWLDGHEPALDDDRGVIQAGDPVLLIVEDDPTFAQVLVENARGRGWKALVALRGGRAIGMAKEFAERHHARRSASGYERMDGAGLSKARSGDAAYSDSCYFGGGYDAGRFCAGRQDVLRKGPAASIPGRIVPSGAGFDGGSSEESADRLGIGADEDGDSRSPAGPRPGTHRRPLRRRGAGDSDARRNGRHCSGLGGFGDLRCGLD